VPPSAYQDESAAHAAVETAAADDAETADAAGPDGVVEGDDAATGSADADIDGAEVGDLQDTSPVDELTAAESAADDDTVAPAKGRSGRWLAIAAGVSAVLFVGVAAFAGAAMQPYLADRALVATKLQIVRTAVNAITALWNYTPENMETLVDRASIYLSGDLEAGYRKFIDQIAATNKQAKVTDNTEITGAALESLDGSEATVLIYTNTTATSELTKDTPSLKYQSHRLFMRHDHNRWVITRMPTITSFNLTPQL
jgi:Mce-associated membrane protein